MSDDDNDGEVDGRRVVWLAVGVEGGLIVLAWLFGWLLGFPPLELFFWKEPTALVEALVGLAAVGPLLLLFFACLRWPIGPLKRIERFCKVVLRPMFAPCSLLDLAGIALLAGFGEEMLFRGVFQEAFRYWTNSVLVGLILASVLFGLCHAITPTYAVLATLMGAYLGYLMLATNNLLPAIVAHAVYDFIALVILTRRKVEEPSSP